MASLKNGVLLKLLDDMKMDENALEDDRKPVLLQIRSIVPVLEEGDLWPNRGFFLKVSDLSHALYVSLPEEQNEMILGNKLKLGQLIYVQKLENAHPVPLLKGVTPIPGRCPCEGTPEDIISPANLLKLLESSSPVDSIVEKGVILEKKISRSSSFSRKLMRGLSDSESLGTRSERLEGGGGFQERSRSLSALKARPREMIGEKFTMRTPDFEKTGYDIVGEWPKSRASSVDNDSDVESVISSASSSTRMSKRRSWNESEILGVKEIFDSSVVKHEIRPPPRSRSANVSPVRSVRYDSSDDNSSATSRRRNVASTRRLIKGANKNETFGSKVNNVPISSSLCNFVHDRKGAEIGISWNSLPSNLAKLGKEVVSQRDVALHAAVDALQEACAAERLLTCLSTLSEFPLAEGDDLQPYVDKFFDLQDDLARTRLIMQSLTSISPFRTSETEPCATNSVKEVLTIALERNKNATAWIKSAVALDLSLSSNTTLCPPTIPVSKKSSDHKPKGPSIVRKIRSATDILPLVLASEKEDQTEWTKGSTLCAGAELAISLQDECRKLFLSYVEKYLDEVERKGLLVQSDVQMAGMMYKVKMVSDWLDMIVNKEGNLVKEEGGVDSEIEAYGRVRNKIYGILLKHVERTAMAFKA